MVLHNEAVRVRLRRRRAGGIDSRPQRLALDVQGTGKNVNLRISDISRSMVSNIPELLLDLLEVAAYVYCADQHAPRGSDKLTLAGSSWRRQLHFVIPVRRHDVWSRPAVLETLTDTLSFLSDDGFSFEFVRATETSRAGPRILFRAV